MRSPWYVNASCAPSAASRSAIAHAIERLFATPSTSACFPSNLPGIRRSYYGRVRDARVRARRLHVPAPGGAPVPARQVPAWCARRPSASRSRRPRRRRRDVGRPPSDARRGLGRARPGRAPRAARGARARAALVARARRARPPCDRRDDPRRARGARGRRRGEPRRRHAPRVRRRRPRVLRLQRRRHGHARAAGRATRRPRRSSSTWTSTRATARMRCSPATRRRFTLSVNGFRNYPFRRVPGDLDVDLPDGTDGRPRTSPRSSRRFPTRSAGPGRSSASSSRAPTRSRATGSAASRSPRRAWSRATHSSATRSPPPVSRSA